MWANAQRDGRSVKCQVFVLRVHESFYFMTNRPSLPLTITNCND